ncbi:arsenate reductase ArsC [Candidatus Bathyarchaeota archaeon]|nr:arsenate reductase ArsC [Candidatus Bathyarchaeota archaeon]
MFTVLFICVHNAGRSQISEALFNYYSNGRYKGISAGSNPSKEVNPLVVEVMKEFGIDISDIKPRKLTKEMILDSDLAITMGCGEEACPIVPNELREWILEDPHNKSLEVIRKIRDEIDKKIKELINELDQYKINNY